MYIYIRKRGDKKRYIVREIQEERKIEGEREKERELE